MRIEFLGTRGNIDTRTQRHLMHSSVKISYYDTSVIIDCGEDWLGEIGEWDAQAIFVTHAHPDHAFGLKEGAPCPVYATAVSWESMAHFDIEERKEVPEREPVRIAAKPEKSEITIEAFPVLHSTRAPAVGYRVCAGRVDIFYVPDVAWIQDRKEALSGIRVYIGDGASLTRSIVRKPDEVIIGHVPIQTQLTWCKKLDVPRAIFTHMGSEIVEGDGRTLRAKMRDLAEERNVDQVEIAYDGTKLILR